MAYYQNKHAGGEMKTICFISLLVLLNCSSIPKKQLLQVESIPEEKVNENISSLLNNSTIKPLEGKTQSKININDNVLKIKEFKISQNTNYEIYKVKTETGKEYSLELFSKCDCFGFTKTMILPIVIIIDKYGNLVKQNLETYEERDATWKLPVHIYNKWKITANDTTLYIIVGADNSYVGERILKNASMPVSETLAAINLGLAGALLMANYPFYASPFGKYEIKFNSYTNEEKKETKIRIKAIN